MTDLQLDGAAVNLDGTELSFDVPEPFGPKKGPAFIKIIAKPSTSANVSFRKKLDGLMHTAKLSDLTAQKQLEHTKDQEKYIRDLDAGAKKMQRAIAELVYDECFISWSTNIQNAGGDMEPTRENFLALSAFEHPVIAGVMEKINRDLGDWDKFSAEAAKEADEATVKNSQTP